MLHASLSRAPREPLSFCRSDPARSTKLKALQRTERSPASPSLSARMLSVRTECERELSRFIAVLPTWRFALPVARTRSASSGESSTSSMMFSTKMPRATSSRTRQDARALPASSRSMTVSL
jgi:hypothetical protein